MPVRPEAIEKAEPNLKIAIVIASGYKIIGKVACLFVFDVEMLWSFICV